MAVMERQNEYYYFNNKTHLFVFRPGGLLVGQLDRVMFYESKSEGEFRPHMLPSDGNFAKAK